MEGLPLKTRRRYFIGFIAVFIVVVPILVLYASGYRISEDFRVIKTGGVHISIPLSGGLFYLDDQFEGSGSLFQKSFFIQNLVPDTYVIRIEKEGFHGWRKEVIVYPQLITPGKALLLPTEPELVSIPAILVEVVQATSSRLATTTQETPNTEYNQVISLFVATSTGIDTAPPGATTTITYKEATTTVREFGDIGLWKDKDGLHVWWLGNQDRLPYFFCELDECDQEILIAGDSKEIGHFDFLPDDNQFVIIEWPDGVFVTELDTRFPQNIQPLYPVPGSSFRVIDGDIVILDDNELFRVEL